MIVDDRLETVLRTVAAGRGAAATQMRQLLDLLGRAPDASWREPHGAALERIDSLAAVLGEGASASLIASASLRSPRLLEHFAAAGPKVALAAISAARLGERDWLRLIPDLPVQARGFLRHRRDLGPRVEALLARLGVTDFALPLPPGFAAPAQGAAEAQILPVAEPLPAEPIPAEPISPEPISAEPPAATPLPAEPATPSWPAGEGISAIIRRIEAFRRTREAQTAGGIPANGPAEAAAQSRLPFADEPLPATRPVTAIDLALDAAGTVTTADTALAPAVVGLRPFAADPDAPVACDPATLTAARARLPITGGRLELEAPGLAAGAWRIDAVPGFAPDTGRFLGWQARLRRPPVSAAAEAGAANDDALGQNADRLRQMLHELRTPINAVQGFAELIQQQLLGPTPHQYRSLAAGIASDAARMLAGFEDVERLALLEAAAARGLSAPGEGATDLTALVTRLVAQLEPVLAPRGAVLAHDLPEGPLDVAMPPEELERTLWRLLSLIASAAAPGERLAMRVRVGAGPRGFAVRLTLPLPASLAAPDETPRPPADAMGPAGMLGSGFALRLCGAEIRAAGGLMVQDASHLDVTLPLLTSAPRQPSQTGEAGGQAG
jgi:signal transduction histidine kinase